MEVALAARAAEVVLAASLIMATAVGTPWLLITATRG